MGNSFSSKSSTFLIARAEDETKNRAILKELESSPELINSCDDDRNTLLHRACKGGNRKLVDRLISKGAEIDPVNSKGMTPFLIACSEGHESIVTTLLANSAKINAKGAVFGSI